MDNPNPSPVQAPAPVPAAPTPAPAPVLSQEAQTLYGNFKAIDPTNQGVGLDKIRPFYPRIGWGKILAWAAELEAAKLLTKTHKLNGKGGVAYHVYSWKDA